MRHRIGIASIRAVLAVSLLLELTASSTAAETVTAPGRWIGRVDETKAAFGWPGSGFAFRFEGRRLVLRLADTGRNHLAAMIDGTPRRIDLGPGEHSYTVFDGPDGTHQVEILKRTEGDVGTVRFVSAQTDGRFLPPEPPRRRLLVIGDSISAGYGIEGAGPHCPFSPDTENQTLTYAGETARRFGAEASVLAASGRGLVRNYDGARGATMPDLMDRALPDVPWPSGPARGPFDLVLVHLGTNDFSGTEEPEGFDKAYGALLETLRARYGQTPIYALLGPMLGPERFAQASEAIEAAVTARREAGDEAVRFLAFPPPPASFGCDWHPGTLAHMGMADALAARLRTDLGW